MLRSTAYPTLLLTTLLALCAAQLSGCSALKGGGTNSGPRYLGVGDLSPALAPYHELAGYDYLGRSVEYRQIGVEEYDRMFYRAAYVKGSLQQLTAMKNRLDEGGLSLDTRDDLRFVTAMAAFAIQTLPTLVTEAPALAGDIATINPRRDLPLWKVPAGLAGLNQMRSNLTGADVGQIHGLIDAFTGVQCRVQAVADGQVSPRC